jgi:D-arginine dehydrogenase
VSERADVLIIGAGMAGASLAAELAAASCKVVLLEAEDEPGRHATGRSAALFSATYGNATVRALTRASWPTFASSPEGFADAPLTRPRGFMPIAKRTETQALARLERGQSGHFERLSAAEVRDLVPILRPGLLAGGLIDRSAADIDVDALHRGYLRAFRRAGGDLVCGQPLMSLRANGRAWEARTPDREITCHVVVDAAGAWADHIAQMADLPPIGLQPKRRTAALVDLPELPGAASWPCVVNLAETFYFKPDAGRLLVSPADETDVAPHDAYADDEALAEGIERIAAVTTLEVKRVPKAWAGLRTFAADRSPVVGIEPSAPTPFFWLAGQGGYGIQTAPALARLASAMVRDAALPDFATPEFLAALSPGRFRG